jgi:hypothetical protein
MKLTKIIAAAVVMSLGVFAGTAQAVPMKATWTGTVTSAFGYAVAGANVGDAAQATFTFDTDNLGAPNNYSQYNYWANYSGVSNGIPGFYTSATYTFGSLSGSYVGTNTPPSSYTYLGSGSSVNYYENYVSNGNGYLDVFINYGSGSGLTNGDPSQTFSTSALPGSFILYLIGGSLQANVTSLTVSSAETPSDPVPAPGALALLGLGLLGLGGLRRKKAA